MEELRRAFLYHYSRCGVSSDIAERHWQTAKTDLEGIVTYNEMATGQLRAYHSVFTIEGAVYSDGSPVIMGGE